MFDESVLVVKNSSLTLLSPVEAFTVGSWFGARWAFKTELA